MDMSIDYRLAYKRDKTQFYEIIYTTAIFVQSVFSHETKREISNEVRK